MVSIGLYSRLTLYVDDATFETVCTEKSVVKQHAMAVNSFIKDLHSMRMTFSETKNVSCATTDALASVANAAIEGFTIRVAGRVTSLGTGLGAGRRRI